MPLIDIPWTDDAPEPGSGALLPEAWYDKRILSVEQKQGPRAPQLQVKTEIVACSDPGIKQGRNSTEWFSMHPNACKFLKALLDACGVDVQTVSGPSGAALRFDPDHLLGKTYRARCWHSIAERGTRKGQKVESWSEWQPSNFGVQPGQQPIQQPQQVQGPQGYQPAPVPQQAPQQQPQPQGGMAVPGGYQPQQAGQGVAPPQPAQPINQGNAQS